MQIVSDDDDASFSDCGAMNQYRSRESPIQRRKQQTTR